MQRRTALKLALGSLLAGFLARCSGPQVIDGGTAPSPFVTAAIGILGNLATWLSEIQGSAPSGPVLAAVVLALGAVQAAQQTLQAYAQSDGTVCGSLQNDIDHAVTAAVDVLAALIRVGLPVPALAIIVVESAGTIADSLIESACNASATATARAAHRRGRNALTGVGTFVAPLFATAHVTYLPLDPTAVCPPVTS